MEKHFNTVKTPVKLGISLKCSFENATQTEDFNMYIHSKYHTVLNKDEIVLTVNSLFESLSKRYDNVTGIKSNAKLKKITRGTIEKYLYTPTQIGNFLPTPPKFAKKKCIINLEQTQKKDKGLCFHYSIMVHYFYASIGKNKSRTSLYREKLESQTKINFSRISKPAKLNEITHFENDNNCAVNIFSIASEGRDSEIIHPYRISQNKTEDQINPIQPAK